jgi:arylformamidase
MGKIQASGETRMTRRSVLCGALVTAAVAAARTVLAQQMQTHLPPRVVAKAKGPLVFLDYDKDEIDFAYDQAPWAPNAGEVAKRNAQKSAAALARLGPSRRVAYGSADIEKLDIYITKQPNAPINVFIHGGAWRTGNAKGAAYMSETFVDAGAHFVSLDFNNVTDVDGNLIIMAEQVRRASRGSTRTRRASAAMPIGSTSRGPRPAVTSPPLRSRPTGRRISDCRPIR